MSIRVLAPEVAARIAAGEVVERPASVVKELVENALDGGATTISVEVETGGLDLVRVTDDGSGIAAEDTAHLFQRHATSKLRAAEDLADVRTMGFRGEALFSLGAAAWVTFLTRRREETVGTFLEARNGQAIRSEPRGAPAGTTVTVRHLFRDLPARRKFLRSPQAELGRAQAVVASYILAFPEVRFSLRSDRRQVLTSPGGGGLGDAALAVYGSQSAPALLSVEGGDGAIAVDGMISPPDVHRANRSYISLYVNRRPIQSRSLVHAVAEAYRGLLPVGRYPLAVLRIGMPPEELDVNVHPAKAEVRFRQENAVYSALQRTVRQALVALAPVPTLEVSPSLPDGSPSLATPYVNPASPRRPWGPSRPHGDRPPPSQPPLQVLPRLRAVGQVQETYIVAEGPDGLYLIDQHAAHECVLYEQLTGGGAPADASVAGPAGAGDGGADAPAGGGGAHAGGAANPVRVAGGGVRRPDRAAPGRARDPHDKGAGPGAARPPGQLPGGDGSPLVGRASCRDGRLSRIGARRGYPHRPGDDGNGPAAPERETAPHLPPRTPNDAPPQRILPGTRLSSAVGVASVREGLSAAPPDCPSPQEATP